MLHWTSLSTPIHSAEASLEVRLLRVPVTCQGKVQRRLAASEWSKYHGVQQVAEPHRDVVASSVAARGHPHQAGPALTPETLEGLGGDLRAAEHRSVVRGGVRVAGEERGEGNDLLLAAPPG